MAWQNVSTGDTIEADHINDIHDALSGVVSRASPWRSPRWTTTAPMHWTCAEGHRQRAYRPLSQQDERTVAGDHSEQAAAKQIVWMWTTARRRSW